MFGVERFVVMVTWTDRKPNPCSHLSGAENPPLPVLSGASKAVKVSVQLLLVSDSPPLAPPEDALYDIRRVPVPRQLPVSGAGPAGALPVLLLLPAEDAAAEVEAQSERPQPLHLLRPEEQRRQQPDLQELPAADQEQEQRREEEEEEQRRRGRRCR